MNSELPTVRVPDAGKESPRGGRWLATFSLLDVSGSISASQLQRLKASIARLWRRTLGRRA